jgi:hypothetical protein
VFSSKGKKPANNDDIKIDNYNEIDNIIMMYMIIIAMYENKIEIIMMIIIIIITMIIIMKTKTIIEIMKIVSIIIIIIMTTIISKTIIVMMTKITKITTIFINFHDNNNEDHDNNLYKNKITIMINKK